jgi:Ribonucleotide reductase, alpha subunit
MQKEETRIPPLSSFGGIIHATTYSRYLNEDHRKPKEQFADTLKRVVRATNNQLHCDFTLEEQEELYELLFNLKCSVAGRFLWQLGTSIIDKLGLLSLQNCAFTVVDDPIRPFTWTFEALMLGSGVGFSIERKYINMLPSIHEVTIRRCDTKDADFIVPDSREGWCKLLKKTLKAHFITGKSFTYSTILLRSKGAPIKSFGGIASGPEILCDGINLISDIFNNRCKTSDRLRPIDVLDIMNIIGKIVVSGNVRRSAELCIGDADDIEYLLAKRWDLDMQGKLKIPNYRCYSNNSVVCSDIDELPDEFWEGYNGNGEPYGLINLDLSRKCGRTGETQYSDPNVKGFNPCAEQTLADKETCCLAEVFLPNIKDEEELWKVVKYLYKICKHSLLLPCHLKETEKIVHENMRMGISVTGYLQAREEQRCWLPACYEKLRAFDVEYSEKLGCPRSIKLTSVKPSGTLSLLAGVTSGVHPAYARYMIRRIRMQSDSPLVDICKEHGYPVEYLLNFDGTYNRETSVVSFPYEYPEGTILARDCNAIRQLEYVARLQREWSDNAVSCTVYYRKEELPEIKEWLRKNYKERIKSVSFLLHSEHGFKQAPFEEITKEEFQELKKSTKPIHKINIKVSDKEMESLECESGACPVR